MLLGFLSEDLLPTFWLYLYTAFPATLLELLGLHAHEGFFGWPTPGAFFLGFLIWGAV